MCLYPSLYRYIHLRPSLFVIDCLSIDRYIRARAHSGSGAFMRVRACAYHSVCACLCHGAVRALSCGPFLRLAVFIARTAARVRLRLCHPLVAHVAAGATWTSRTRAAPWAARSYHTSVIGGYDYSINYNDVWASTDGGARRDSCVLEGYSVGTKGVLRAYYRGS